MAFDQTTRNRLARFVSDARALLTEEFTRQLQNEYGLDPASGDLTPIERLTALDDRQRETARILRETLDYYLAGNSKVDGKTNRDVLDRIVREQAFTVLNRLCALRMSEARGLVLESIVKGYQSKGFQLYARLAGSALGETGEAYHMYLFSLMDEFAVDLPVLFDRFSAQGRLFPREAALLKLLELINDVEIESLWSEDETIGWIYQYFNSKEERKAMRDASQAPRNSRELAVRNQFFTPRYVVEFLTDNTLGRIWYEMTRGETVLKDTCHYLVRRPNEIFLDQGEAAPKQTETDENLSQEELLRQPVYIPHRPLKDPRELKMLDPACGSMHFGLYAFDLFEQIYAEAWELEERLGEDALQRLADLEPLHKTYPDKESYLKDVPRLIIERNIHGVDIDSRAVQIAGLSLWLRAQKSWQAQGLRSGERPQIRKSNVVCAEPMPGDLTMLEEFLSALRGEGLEALMRKAWHVPAGQKIKATPQMADALAKLVRTVWQEMELAGEAGSLLKIEETLRDAIATARKESEEKSPLFRVLEYGLSESPIEKYVQVVAGEDQSFFDRSESLVLAALREYSELAENGGGYRRRLFSGDTIQGFAFIDLCRKQYDVVLMNPPFGAPAVETQMYITKKFPASKDDIYAAFVDRYEKKLIDGKLGIISNRTGLFLASTRKWRESILLGSTHLTLLADLGDGVLDDALVEAAAYVVAPGNEDCIFFRLLDQDEKSEPLHKMTQILNTQQSAIYIQKISSFFDFPESRISYWASGRIREIFRSFENSKGSGLDIKFGLSTKDDVRFLRLCWEIPINRIVFDQKEASRSKQWMYLAKGGDYSLYYGDIHLVANWMNFGNEIAALIIAKYPYLNGDANWVLHREVPYGQPGITYTRRTTSGFSPRILPNGNLISDVGATIFADSIEKLPKVLAAYASRVFGYILEFNLAAGDSVHSGSAARTYEIGAVASIPLPSIDSLSENLGEKSIEIWKRKVRIDSQNENSRYFISPFSIAKNKSDISNLTKIIRDSELESHIFILDAASKIEDELLRHYSFDAETINAYHLEFGQDVTKYSGQIENDDGLLKIWKLTTSELIKLTSNKLGFSRFISKMTYIADRRIELISHLLKVSPRTIATVISKHKPTPIEKINVTENILSYAIGAAFGRWDILYSINKKEYIENADPFAPFPACPPGMLQNDQGLPVSALNELQEDYPLRISWSGILVDDEGHPEDVEARLCEALHVVWGERAEAIEADACQILGVRSLREYFRKPTLFFVNHLKHYSKSRRQAPIYWPLSTPSCSYTLCLYYHRLNDQTLYTCVNDFVDPKLKQVSEEAIRLRLKKGRSGADEKDLEHLTDFERELKDFREELLRVAKFWKPNLNDGVEITAAPLWKLFQHKPWQKRLRETWQKLEAGEYDWAHLAYSIWPDRVREKCKSDKSLAVAHDLEALYVESKKPLNKKESKKKATNNETEGWFDED